MILINTVDTKYFTIDGVRFARIYQPIAQGSAAIGIYNIYDTKQQLKNSSDFTEFSIDGTTYNTQSETVTAILDVIWSGVSDYDVEVIENRVLNLEENQFSGVVVYETFAELPLTGTLLVSYKVSNDPTSSNNGYYHWDGADYVKDASLNVGVISLGNTDAVEGGKIFEYVDGYLYDGAYEAGKFVNTTTGLLGNSGSFSASEIIDASQLDSISFSNMGTFNVCLYDDSENIISGQQIIDSITIDLKKVYNVRYSILTANIPTATILLSRAPYSTEFLIENDSTEISDIENMVQTVNLFNEDESSDYVPVPDYRWSNYIRVNEGDVVRRNFDNSKLWGIYDINKIAINEAIPGALEYTVLSGTKYIRSLYSSSANLELPLMITVNNAMPSKNIAYGFNNPYLNFYNKEDAIFSSIYNWAGKKLAFLGDSITYGYIPPNSPNMDYPGQLTPFGELIANELQAEFYNYGVTGQTLARVGATGSFLDRYDTMIDDADLIVVMGGTNDIRKDVPLGVMGDSGEFTFYGGLDILCRGLIEKYHIDQISGDGPNKQLLFMTPLKLDTVYGTLYNGKTIQDFGQAVKEVCNYYSIPVFDMESESGINPHIFLTVQGFEGGALDLYNPYITDGVHPTQQGHQMMANRLIGYLRQLK